jgi:phosphatidate cytidylyltransferase
MKIRVITGAVLLAVFAPIFVIGGLVFDSTLVLLTMVGTWEISKMYQKDSLKPKWITGVEVLFSGGLFFLIRGFYLEQVAVEGIFYLIILMFLTMSMLLIFVEDFSSKEFGNFFISVLYPALGFSALSGLRSMDNGLLVIGFLFMVTVFTDVFAYIVGVNFGKHRLAPKISPKKSIEGSIGGSFFAVVFTLVYIYFTKLTAIDSITLNIGISIVLILVISVMGQIGDLVASKLKRDCEVKDYSNIFPGHGGVMDRFDSAIFAAMVLMLVVKVVGLWM